MKRVLLVEDHAVFRQALALVLKREMDLREDAQAGSLAAGRACVAVLYGAIDLAIVDLLLPDGDGTELIRELHQREPAVPVLALAESKDRERYARAFEAGAGRVLAKSASLEEVLAAVRRLGRSGAPFRPTERLP